MIGIEMFQFDMSVHRTSDKLEGDASVFHTRPLN